MLSLSCRNSPVPQLRFTMTASSMSPSICGERSIGVSCIHVLNRTTISHQRLTPRSLLTTDSLRSLVHLTPWNYNASSMPLMLMISATVARPLATSSLSAVLLYHIEPRHNPLRPPAPRKLNFSPLCLLPNMPSICVLFSRNWVLRKNTLHPSTKTICLPSK